MKAVIFAGGTGTRLWPVSRQRNPKQAQPFGDNQTLLQKTYARLRRGFAKKDIWLSTSADQYKLLRKQIPALPTSQVIVEPARRGTSAAIGLAATLLQKRFPGVTMATVWADSYIRDPEKYLRTVRTAEKVTQTHPTQTVLIGLKPRTPDTGLGYLKLLRQVDEVDGADIFLLDRFIEKPTQSVAERFVRSWRYLWNPGMFMFKVDVMLQKYRRWLPSTYRGLQAVAAASGPRESSVIKRVFPGLKKIPIEYAIMEKDQNLLAIPADFTWSDIGTWSAVYEMLHRHVGHNVSLGRHVTIDSHGNLLFSFNRKLIATAGLRDMIIIETDDALLVCPKHRAQDVKKLVEEIERQELYRHL